MSSVQLPSEACCTVPPVQVKDYKEKGNYIDLNGTKTYVTGPSNASSAIFIVFDIFGYSPQALQGADILAHSDKSHQYRVYMPDFFHGKALPVSVYPPDTDEKKKTLGDFFSGPAAPGPTKEAVEALLPTLKSGDAKDVKKWGIVGFCWGAKIVNLLSQKGTLFTAAANCHPSMIDPADAEKITIPIAVLASGDEDAEQVKKFGEALKVEKYEETYEDQCHGFLAARADLGNERVRSEFERGYSVLLTWFHKYL